MAMGGLMKVNHHHHGSRGKPYGLMILLAFVAAILGVMALHKVREKRVFNLLVKEKDTELSSLRFLLQKERDHATQAKWKLEEMKTKVNTLRAQKRGLDSRIVEMQSTISSLKEEQRTIELALDEKQNEIKVMRERYTEVSDDNPQVIALSEKLRQKESEVEDLKTHLETPLKVWSVSTDDPSSANINLQTATSMTERDDKKAIRERETGEPTNRGAEKNATELADSGSESAEVRNEEHATQGEDRRKGGGETVDSRGEITEQTEKIVDPEKIVSENGKGNLEDRNAKEERNNSNESETGEASGTKEEKNSQIQTVENHDDEGSRFRDEIHERYSTKKEVLKTTGDGLQGKTSKSEGAENQEPGLSYKGGMKLEIGRSRLDVEGYLRKGKRKKLNKIHKTRKNIEKSIRNGAAATSNTSFTAGTKESKMDKDGYQGTMSRNENHYKSLSVENNSGKEDHESKIVEKLLKNKPPEQEIREKGGVGHGEEQKDFDIKKVETRTQEKEAISQGIELQRHDDDAQEFRKDKKTTEVKVERGEIANDTSKSTELHISLKDVSTNTSFNAEDEMLSKTKQQNNFEPENQATSIQQPEERIDAHYKDEVSEQTDPVSNKEEPDKAQAKDATQTESETDVSRESVLYSEADGKSYNERPEEPEF